MKREDFSPARWDTISRKAGVVRGLRQWRKELSSFADQKEREAEGADDEVSEAGIESMRGDSRAARTALFFIEELAQDLRPPRPSASSGGVKWQEFCQWAEELLRKYLPRRLPDDESAVKERIDRMLQELKAADSLSSVATLTAFRGVVEDYFQRPEGHIGITGEGVFVAPFSAAAGMSFDAVWVVGMVEGRYRLRQKMTRCSRSMNGLGWALHPCWPGAAPASATTTCPPWPQRHAAL